MAREAMEFDAVIVGGGPAGLAAAVRLGRRARDAGATLTVAVLEKGPEIGAHILSGAVMDPTALDELIPDWRNRNAPLDTPATRDVFQILTARRAFRLKTPRAMKNHGNYIVSLGAFCRWLAGEAEALGIEIFAGFAASEVLYDGEGRVAGVATGDMGVGRDGKPKPGYQPGVELRARHTIFAEGCRGSLTKSLMQRFGLDADSDPQTYAIGIKELWEVDPARHLKGLVSHSIGWPLDRKTYGGSFLYHFGENLVSVGFVIGLDYENPYLNPYEEFQRFKTHPAIRPVFEGGRRIAYGARALNEGGVQSVPHLAFPGGVLVGCAAGFMNVPRIKGSHTAIKSGMLAADAAFERLAADGAARGMTLSSYDGAVRQSWLWRELKAVRNIRPAFDWGLLAGLVYSALDSEILRGMVPWTLRKRRPDHRSLKPAKACTPIAYPKPDGTLTFDRLSSVFISNTHHEEDQPCHLVLADPDRAIDVNLAEFDAPEQRYCPAGVYEIVHEDGRPRLQINAQNCVHCKTCDIKDPTQNITWVPPEGGGGPVYSNM